MIECQICFEHFQSNQIGKVGCGSSVDHNLCFGCEKTWRSKMPIKKGLRIMNCPTCRQPEQYRTIESLQRETQTTQTSQTDYAALIAAEMAQANRVVQIIQRQQAERAALRAVARAAAPSVSTITREELSAINARLMGRAPTAPREATAPGEATAPREASAREALARPPRSRCASGRNCRSTSQSGRSMTHLKCTHCNTVFCCRTCKECLGCRPFPSYMLPYVEQLRL
jgi:hypothetical protein